ncbi:MAG: hypothetical protein HY903_23930 [Deltaproteobacteria bacterium]|nr:hypothetical protein [Deltaproteobacteria bacterium]
MTRAAWLSGFVAVAVAAGAQAAPTPRANKLARARDLYFAGRYAEALPLFDAVAADNTVSDTDRIECLKYQAFTLYLLKLPDDAKSAWLELLRRQPDFELDPVETSPELLSFFGRIKAAELGTPPPAAAPRLKPAADKTPAEKATPPPSEPEPLVIEEPPAKGCPTWLCLVPFGAGQFRNGSPVKGLAFAGGELAFLAGNVGMYWMRVANYQQNGVITNEQAYRRAFILQHVFLGLFVATAVGGVVEAFVSR